VQDVQAVRREEDGWLVEVEVEGYALELRQRVRKQRGANEAETKGKIGRPFRKRENKQNCV
jgi:hypothetical protein